MHIDSYSFGKMVIDGREHNNDCIVFSDEVRGNWWRKRGHLLNTEDLDWVLEKGPEILVIGCGASGIMKVPDEVIEFLNSNDIRAEVYNTAEAVRRFNELQEEGTDVSGAFHLTC